MFVPLLFSTPLCCAVWNHPFFPAPLVTLTSSTSSPFYLIHIPLFFLSSMNSLCLFSMALFYIYPCPTVFSHTFNSSALSSCHNRVYQSLANLIRWADQVMLDGIDLEDKENVASVTSVIKAVLDGVKVNIVVGVCCILLWCFLLEDETVWVVFL